METLPEAYYTDFDFTNSYFVFKGRFCSDVITSIFNLSTLVLKSHNEPFSVQKRVSSTLIEVVQNIYHHAEHKDSDILQRFGKHYGIVALKYYYGLWNITSGNFVHNNTKLKLQNQIDEINNLSNEQLNEFYKFVLYNQKFTDKGGGGLGMLDIARKIEKPIRYKFLPFSDKISFFIVTIDIRTAS